MSQINVAEPLRGISCWRFNFIRHFLMLTAVVACFALNNAFAAADKSVTEYRFGIVPQGTPTELAKRWTPVLNYLSQASGVKLVFATTPSIPAFEEGLAHGDYDFAYMNPYHFVVFNSKPGYQALARNKGERIEGVIVVEKNSPYKKIQDLAGAQIAFPAPNAFAATIIIRNLLDQNKIAYNPVFVKSHNSVYQTVAKGIYPAGGGIVRTLHMQPQAEQDQLRILWTSPVYTPHAIATRPGLPDSVRESIWQAMEKMNNDPEAAPLLKEIAFNGFTRSKNSDWNDIRKDFPAKY